jgi:hypothetical protein
VKLALVPIVLVLGLSLAACGSDDSEEPGQSSLGAESVSPGIGSEDEAAAAAPFCDALLATASVRTGEDVADLRDSLAEAGLPDEAGEDAQAGLEVYLEVLGRVEPDATARDLATLEDPDLTQREQAQVDAMVGYATTACAAGAGQDPESPESPSAE